MSWESVNNGREGVSSSLEWRSAYLYPTHWSLYKSPDERGEVERIVWLL